MAIGPPTITPTTGNMKKIKGMSIFMGDCKAERSALLKNLSREAIHIDELIKSCALDSSTINATLTMMEMKGKVRNLGGMQYVLSQ